MKNYTLKEIVRETGKEIEKSAPYIAGRGIIETLTFPYAFLTINRRVEERANSQNDYEKSMFPRALGGSLGLLATLVPLVSIYKRPSLYAIPIATNTLSWLYEKVRTAKQNLENKKE